MAGTIRDRLKTRTARLGEVLSLSALKAGQANSQTVLWGCALSVNGSDPDLYDVSAGEVLLAGSIVAVAADASNDLTSAVDTTAGQYRKVLVEVNASGVVSQKIGNVAASQDAAVLPDLSTDKVAIGYIEIPASFTANTTDITAGMLKTIPYHA